MLPFLLRASRAAIVIIIVFMFFFLLIVGCPSRAGLVIFHNVTLIFISTLHLNRVSIFFLLFFIINNLLFLLA
jgi:hypothetical protein